MAPSTPLAPSTTASKVSQPTSSGSPTGPMTSSVDVPARAKPGRKASTDEPDDKRKARSRAVQRAFRARKTNAERFLISQNSTLKAANDQLEAEVTLLRTQVKQVDDSRIRIQRELVAAQEREGEVIPGEVERGDRGEIADLLNAISLAAEFAYVTTRSDANGPCKYFVAVGQNQLSNAYGITYRAMVIVQQVEDSSDVRPAIGLDGTPATAESKGNRVAALQTLKRVVQAHGDAMLHRSHVTSQPPLR